MHIKINIFVSVIVYSLGSTIKELDLGNISRYFIIIVVIVIVVIVVIVVIICMCCCGCLLVFKRLSKFGEEKAQVTPVTNPDECFPEEQEDKETHF